MVGASSPTALAALGLAAAAAAASIAQAQAQPAAPVMLPLTYRSQRPLADAAPLRRHKALAIGEAGVGAGGHFLGIDRMHLPARGGASLMAVS